MSQHFTAKIGDSLTAYLLDADPRPATEFNSDVEIVNKDGKKKYIVPVQQPDGSRVKNLDVIIWADSNPCANIPALSPVVFKDVELHYGTYFDRSSGKQKKYWNVQAESMKKA